MSDNHKPFNIGTVKGTPNYMEFVDLGLRIYKPAKDYETGKLAVQVPAWGRWVMCADYDNHFVALSPYFADQRYPGLNTVWAFCSCGSPAVVIGYKQYKEGFSASSGGKGFVAGELLVCQAFTDNLTTTGIGKHLDGSG